MFVTTLAGIVCAVAAPQILAGLDRSRAAAAARYVAQQCGAARIQAVARSASVALRFRARDADYEMQMFVDGNDDGVRSTDIEVGIDTALAEAQPLGVVFPGVRIGVAPDLAVDPDAVKAGASGLLSFSPLGTATSGSILITARDGSQFAVRIFGVTARARVERYDRRQASWVSQW